MQKAILFFLAIVILFAIAYKPVEGFQNTYSKSDPLPLAEHDIGNIEPGPPPPSDLPSAPTGFLAKETPNPYREPTLEPAKYIRLIAVKEDLQAFFGFEAESLPNKSDPSIEIPLTRARADLSELIDIQSVIERNPGLQSRINNKQLNDMKSNLNYLREIINTNTNNIINPKSEGFTNYEMASNQSTRMKNMQKLQRLQSRQYRRSMQRLQRLQSRQRMQNRRRMQRLQNRQSRQSRQRINNETPASLTQLRSFLYKINIEITRLSASGTSDPLIVSRINTLTNIKNDVIDVIKKIKTGVYTPDTVPIMESDINKSLPILGNQNAPLPRILKRLNLPREASSLFPNGMSPKDSEQAAQINNIMKGYMKNLFEGASWNFNIQYEPPNKRSSCDTSPEGLPGLKNKLCNSLLYSSEDPINTKGSPYKNNSSEGPTKLKGLPGVDDSSGNSSRDNIVQQGRPGSLTNRIFPDTRAGNFSWEERSKEIVKQIRKRGLNPLQYGAIPDNTIVSDEFSWRGYTRMMCMRLNATTDPGLAITVGCPPEEWNGWKE